MPVRRGRELWLRYDVTGVLARVSRSTALTAALLLAASTSLQTAIAEGDTRTLSFHHSHTGESITVTFKRNGAYDQAALKQLNWFMRDWRKERATEMSPELFDILWETNRAVGGTQPIEVICGYRSPETNAMLRRRSRGVAEQSLHTKGDAMDFFIPGVPLEKVREVGLRLQRGGVGFYPTSGSPFVHLDTGAIRHWPRMTYAQLSKVFPDGRTVHVPSNGHPLPGYALALADVERAGHTPSSLSLMAARNGGMIDDNARGIATDQPGIGTLLAGLFGAKKDNTEPVTTSAAPTTVASLKASKSALAAIPVPKARPVQAVEVATNVPMPAARPGAAGAIAVAIDEPVVTASAMPTLAYASAGAIPAAAYTAAAAKPMGAAAASVTPPATTRVAKADATAALTDPLPIKMLGDNPWLRAMVVTPNASTSLTASAIGKYDTLQFAEFMAKPRSMVMMTFAAEPYYDLSADRFSGSAVVFVATATFGTRTALLTR